MSSEQDAAGDQNCGAEEGAGYSLETVQATLAANEWDLEREEDRMRSIDAKLTQLAAFSGVSISISGLGAGVLASGRLELGFLIALGVSISVAASLLLAAVATAFSALSPKLYKGVDETAVGARTTPNSLKRKPEDAMAFVAAGRGEVLNEARSINDRKANAATWSFVLVGLGFAALVLGLITTAVASVV